MGIRHLNARRPHALTAPIRAAARNAYCATHLPSTGSATPVTLDGRTLSVLYRGGRV